MEKFLSGVKNQIEAIRKVFLELKDRLLGRRKPVDTYAQKLAAFENILGPMCDMVGHSIIPFEIGGAVDMYYFPNGIRGTGFATMELMDFAEFDSGADEGELFELLAFTRHSIKDSHSRRLLYRMEMRIWSIFTNLAHYSREAVIKPGDTAELPLDEKGERCLIFDKYSPDGKKNCLLLVIEVFRSEMEYAMEHGSSIVLNRLKEAGYYPYSDLDREPLY